MRAVNLIPAEHREGAAVGAGRSEGAAYAVMAAIAGVAALALLYGSAKHEVSSRAAQAASLSAQVQSTQAQASQLAPYTSFVALREQRKQAVTTLVDSRFDWAHAFHELGRVVPANISIDTLTGTITAGAGGATLSGVAAIEASKNASTQTVASVTPPGATPVFTLGGCGTSQKAVALFMVRLRLMDGVSNVTLQNSTRGAGSSSSGSCGAGAPVFSLTVDFDALPSTAAETASVTSKAEPASATHGAGSAENVTNSGSAVR